MEAAGKNPGLVGTVEVTVSLTIVENEEVEVNVLMVTTVLVSVIKSVDVVENTSVIALFVIVTVAYDGFRVRTFFLG